MLCAWNGIQSKHECQIYKISKEVVMTYFTVLTRHLLVNTDENLMVIGVAAMIKTALTVTG